MNAFGFLFPGQGAQYSGMGRDLYESPAAKKIFDQADQLLGRPISKLCFEGPEEELTRTVNAQLAIFVMSFAVLSAAQNSEIGLKQPRAACGLSLGEFTALTALEVITFENGLKLVQRRAELMEEACQKQPGTMASIMGLSAEQCEAICQQTGAELANLNSPDQTVISGAAEQVKAACEKAGEAGAKRAIVLKVGGAFHSSLMKHAEKGLEEALKAVPMKEPKGVFIPNVTAEPVRAPEEIKSLLARQLTHPVQWTKTMQKLNQIGIRQFFEFGPGKVLKGLARKIDSSFQVWNIEKKTDLDQLKSMMEGIPHGT